MTATRPSGIDGSAWAARLLQKADRDTQKFAFKYSEITVNGVDVPVFKDPVTDSGKRSFAGNPRVRARRTWGRTRNGRLF